jgi:hypothetical protein
MWPIIVGSATTQAMYIVLWLLLGKRLKREHAIACIISGVAATAFAIVITQHWDNSNAYWIAFTLGLCVLAGIEILVSGLSGKIVAGIGFVLWSMLAAATLSVTSFGFNVTVAILLLLEVYKNGPCNDG